MQQVGTYDATRVASASFYIKILNVIFLRLFIRRWHRYFSVLFKCLLVNLQQCVWYELAETKNTNEIKNIQYRQICIILLLHMILIAKYTCIVIDVVKSSNVTIGVEFPSVYVLYFHKNKRSNSVLFNQNTMILE